MHLRAETPPPRRAQPAAGGDDAWTSSPLPRPMKIPEESCFSSPKPFSSPTPPLCHGGKENVRPLQVPLASQTPVKTPSRLPTVKEQEGQMPSLAEVDTLPVYVASTPTPMKEALDFSEVDGELLLPKVKHTFYNFDTPLRMVDNMRSPPKSAPPGCAPPGLDPPEGWGLFGGPLPAAPPMPMPAALDGASRPALLLDELSGQPPSPRQQAGDVRRLDLAKYLDAPSAPAAACPGPLPAAMADAGKCQGQAWMDWQCMQGGMVLPQPLELPMAGEYPADGQCWGAAGQACGAMPAGGLQDGMVMAQNTGLVMDSMTMSQGNGLVLDAALQPQQQQLTMEQVQAQMQAQMQMQQQQPQPAVTMQQLQALMQFWQMPYQSTAPPAMQAPAPAPELGQQLQLPLPLQPPAGAQLQPGTCPSASEQLMALPQILSEPPSMPGAEHRECLFLCGAAEPMAYPGAACGDRPAFPAPEAPPPAVTLAQTPQPPRVNICVSHFPPPSTPAHAPEAAATPPPPAQPPQQPPAAGGGAAGGGGEAGGEAPAKEDSRPPASAKGSAPSGSKPRRRRGAR